MNIESNAQILLKDIPNDTIDEVREKLWTYTASIFSVAGSRPPYCGTATCISFLGKHYLLTAAHVWNELRGDRFALSLETDHVTPIYLNCVEPTVLRPIGPAEWGPDLAIIKLPEIIAAEVRNDKAFYNIDKHRSDLHDESAFQEGMWGVIGAPAEQSTFGEKEAVLRISLFCSVVVSAVERGDFDYVDLGFYHEGRPNLPHSYGGVSGSGLWHAPITKSASGVIQWTGEVRLEGVAFYQKFLTEHEGVIRCHGRRSIYEKLLKRVAEVPIEWAE